MTSRRGRSAMLSISVLVTAYLLARRPGMSGTTGSAPVLITMASAVIVSRASPGVPSTVFGATNVARPVATVTVSITSSIWKFFSRRKVVRSSAPPTALRYHCPATSPLGRVSAWCTRAFVGTQPMLMRVPPYMRSQCSTIATRLPCRPIVAASVLPPLPKPRTRMSTCIVFMPPHLSDGVDPTRREWLDDYRERLMDTVSRLIRLARPEGSVDVRCLLAGQFLLDNPASRPGKAPFHLLLEGRCAVEYRARTIQLCAGDVVLFPHGGAHRVLVEHGAEPVEAGEKPGVAFPTLQSHGAGAEIDLFCGHYSLAPGAGELLLRTLPEPLHVSFGTHTDDPVRMLSTLMRQEAPANGPGTGGNCVA